MRPELPIGPFEVIVADPPWQFDSSNSLPYPTLPIEDIEAMPVREIADENAFLWLWIGGEIRKVTELRRGGRGPVVGGKCLRFGRAIVAAPG